MSPLRPQLKKSPLVGKQVNGILAVSMNFIAQLHKKTDVVGVDLGVKTLATLSDGKISESVNSLKRFEAKLSRMQYLNRNNIDRFC